MQKHSDPRLKGCRALERSEAGGLLKSSSACAGNRGRVEISFPQLVCSVESDLELFRSDVFNALEKRVAGIEHLCCNAEKFDPVMPFTDDLFHMS